MTVVSVVIDGVVAPVLHRYVPPAGETVVLSVAVPPRQYEAFGSVMVGSWVTVISAVSVHPLALVQMNV